MTDDRDLPATAPALNHVRGGSGEPMVLLHGLGSDRHAWDAVRGALEAHHDVLALDLPGFGRSPMRSDGRVTIYAHADAVAEAMDRIGWDTAHLVGNSLGGAIAFELARRGRARTVVAIAPAGGASRWEHRLAHLNLAVSNAVSKVIAPVAPWLTRSRLARTVMFRGVASGDPGAVDPEWGAAATRSFARSEGFDATRRAFEPEHVRVILAEVDCPVRLLWGTADILLFPRQARRFAERLPNCETVHLEGLGHVPMIDDPVAVAEAILAFTAPR